MRYTMPSPMPVHVMPYDVRSRIRWNNRCRRKPIGQHFGMTSDLLSRRMNTAQDETNTEQKLGEPSSERCQTRSLRRKEHATRLYNLALQASLFVRSSRALVKSALVDAHGG